MKAANCPACGCPGAVVLEQAHCLSLTCQAFSAQERGAYEVARLRELRRVRGLLPRFWRFNGAWADAIEAGLMQRDGARP